MSGELKLLIWRLILLVELLNVCSFLGVRLHAKVHGRLGGELVVYQEDESSDGLMTFLVAGCYNQPESAFRFLESEMCGTVVNVNYDNFGCNMYAMSQKICDYIYEKEPKQVLICTISVGDHVARYLEDEFNYPDAGFDLKVVPINPCPDVDSLVEPLQSILKTGMLFVKPASYALGWINTIPILQAAGGRYSLGLLLDQYWEIAYDEPPMITDRTIGIICSQPEDEDSDGFIDNAYVREYFETEERGIPVVTIVAEHGSSSAPDAADEYLRGFLKLEQLLQ